MNFSELSKEVSYALRHAPWGYELELDENGGVPLEQLLSSLQLTSKWENLTVIDLIEMIEKSEKKRHVIYDSKIRAFYGHSIPMKIVKEEKTPPEFLYHGTARRFLNSIKEKGLLPQSRQYVHLSQDIETAETVGKRHDNKAGILIIDSLKAWNDGIKFYYGNEKVWLADMVPYKYVLVK